MAHVDSIIFGATDKLFLNSYLLFISTSHSMLLSCKNFSSLVDNSLNLQFRLFYFEHGEETE